LKQKPNYAINYKEINELWMSKKIYEKDYNAYRLVGDDNMINMITKYTLEVEDLQK